MTEGNALYLAKTPNFDRLLKDYPTFLLSASGLSVGVNEEEPGNSEVGHLNIGSGRVVWESLPRINQMIIDGSFAKSSAICDLFSHLKKTDGSLHLIGLASAGGVHSHINHILYALELAKENKQKKVFLHLISDGRDTAPQVFEDTIKEIKKSISRHGLGKIASIIGRFYAMDRDKHFERTEKAYNLWVKGSGKVYSSAEEAVKSNYAFGLDDEHLEPAITASESRISAGDAIFFLNYRSDRMKQILSAFENENFSDFETKKIANLKIVTMTQYNSDQKSTIVVPPINMKNVLSEVISDAGLTQSHIAETEKYAHVTYFFNGGVEDKFKNEEQILVPSPRVPDYSQIPAMSAEKVCTEVLKSIKAEKDFIVVNFANGDMVGHTGNLLATVKAVETVDDCLGKIANAAKDYVLVVTADHGNCEMMLNPMSGEKDKEHTSLPVPLILADFLGKPFLGGFHEMQENDFLQFATSQPTGILADIAPTILSILGLKIPKEFSGTDLSKFV